MEVRVLPPSQIYQVIVLGLATPLAGGATPVRRQLLPRWALPAAWILVVMVITVVAVATLLVTGHLVYGLPEPDDLLGVAIGSLLGAFAFISIGIALGMALPSARSAQGLGMLLFFPFFLLGGAGPPPDAVGDPMSSI